MRKRPVMEFLVLAGLVYFAPAIVALSRSHMSAGAIVVLNLLLGWTALGWIIAIVWAFTGNTRTNMLRMARIRSIQND